jgi:hypothetical protein
VNTRSFDGLWRSLVSALRSGRRGPRFKSGQPDHRSCSSEGRIDGRRAGGSVEFLRFGAIWARSNQSLMCRAEGMSCSGHFSLLLPPK